MYFRNRLLNRLSYPAQTQNKEIFHAVPFLRNGKREMYLHDMTDKSKHEMDQKRSVNFCKLQWRRNGRVGAGRSVLRLRRIANKFAIR